MSEWLIEDGIGESRALLIDNGEVRAAKLRWPGELFAGLAAEAQLTRKHAGTRRGIATMADGTEVLVDHLPTKATEGSKLAIQIIRAAVAERGRLKRPQARCIALGASPIASTISSEKDVFAAGQSASKIRAEAGFSQLWEEVWQAASSGSLEFPGGEILISVTPAMVVIDIDGSLPPRALALAAIPAIVRALRWFDIGGSIGIDFPSLAARTDRRLVDEALAEALADWPHERTAMNGFGFVHLVARCEGPSLLHRFQASRRAMCARAALRRAEQVAGPGTVLLTVHPALKPILIPEWLDELARRIGRKVRIETDPGLALEASSAQIVTL